MNPNSLLRLYKAPERLPLQWQAIFDSLVTPLKLIHFYFRNPSVWHVPAASLQGSFAALKGADAGAEKTLHLIDGIAPQTWTVGDEIRMAVSPVLEELADIASLPQHRMQELYAHCRKRLEEKLKPLATRHLLLALRKAVTVEKGIDLAGPQTEGEEEQPQYVTLDQAAIITRQSKKTLERYLNDRRYQQYNMPSPEVEGGGGRSHKWRWSVLRPWLENTFGMILPHRYPSLTPPT